MPEHLLPPITGITEAERPCTAGADPERLYRLMRFATVHGLFKASRRLRQGYGPETTKFSNNALSACLREDHPNCQKHAVSALTLSCKLQVAKT